MMAKTIVNLRQSPDLKSSVSWILSPDQAFKVGRVAKGWYPVYPVAALSSAKPVGYVSSKFVTEAHENSDAVDWGDIRYIGSDTRFYSQRNENSPVAGKLEKGDEIKVGFLRDGWYGIFPVDRKAEIESEATGYIKADLVDLNIPESKIRYAVRKTPVIEKPKSDSQQIGILYPGHRAQVGSEQGGMYALYRIDTKVTEDTPVWGYAWGPFLASYPQDLEKDKLAGFSVRDKEKEALKAKKEKEFQERQHELDVMNQAFKKAVNTDIPTRELYAYAVLNIRSKPDINSIIVGKLEKGDKILAGPADGKWFPVFQPGKPVKSYNEALGYVYGTYLKADPIEVEVSDNPKVKKRPSGPDQVPIKISSTKMTFSEGKKEVTFSGNVKVTRLDITLTSDSLTAFLRQGSDSLSDAKNKIKKIEANGNVDVIMKNRKGSCDKLTFLVDDSIILMHGDAKLEDGKNVVQGNTIKFYLKDERSEVIGGSKPVEAIFFTPKDVAP